MYCSECGKQNPEGAKFCAFCGTKLTDQAAPAQPIERPEPAQPALKPAAAPSAPKPDPHQAYKRPGDDVRPTGDNPAQPNRGAEQRSAPKPAAPQAHQQAAPQPVVRKPQVAVTSSGGEVMPPSRAPNVKRSGYSEVTHRQPVVSPYAKPKRAAEEDDEDDLFFEDVDEPYDDEEEDNIVRHLKSAIAVLFLVLVLGSLGWLFLSGSGQLFRANLGLPVPAEAYRELGDQRAARNELKGAADAYYSALKLDPNNYTYALQVGKAYQLIGDDETAIKAFQRCIELRGNLPEPYKLLAEALDRVGNADAANRVREVGNEKTGDASLLRSGTGERQEDIQDPVPAMPQG